MGTLEEQILTRQHLFYAAQPMDEYFSLYVNRKQSKFEGIQSVKSIKSQSICIFLKANTIRKNIKIHNSLF